MKRPDRLMSVGFPTDTGSCVSSQMWMWPNSGCGRLRQPIYYVRYLSLKLFQPDRLEIRTSRNAIVYRMLILFCHGHLLTQIEELHGSLPVQLLSLIIPTLPHHPFNMSASTGLCIHLDQLRTTPRLTILLPSLVNSYQFKHFHPVH